MASKFTPEMIEYLSTLGDDLADEKDWGNAAARMKTHSDVTPSERHPFKDPPPAIVADPG